jgi:Na+-driven multidrug efflux pump
MVTFPIVGFQMVITNFFQSIGKAKISMFLSLSRQMLFLLPLLITLPLWFGVDGIWWAMPISDTIAALVTLVLMTTYMKRFRRKYNCA